MKKRRLYISLIIMLIIVLSIFFGREIWGFVLKHETKFSLGWGILATLFAIYYSKYEWFYLFIQKYLVSPFVHYHSKWRFISKYSGIDLSIENAKKKIHDTFKDYDYTIKKDLNNHVELILQDEITFKFDLIENGFITIEFRTTKFTVPTSKYEDEMSKFTALFNKLSKSLKPEKESYQITILFEDKNPYFGFFIRYLPPDKVKNFNCSFISPKENYTQVTASKNNITIDSEDSEYLRRSTIDYLFLNDTIVTK